MVRFVAELMTWVGGIILVAGGACAIAMSLLLAFDKCVRLFVSVHDILRAVHWHKKKKEYDARMDELKSSILQIHKTAVPNADKVACFAEFDAIRRECEKAIPELADSPAPAERKET